MFNKSDSWGYSIADGLKDASRYNRQLGKLPTTMLLLKHDLETLCGIWIHDKIRTKKDDSRLTK